MDFDELLKTVGSLAGIIAFVWRVFDEFGSYLRISLDISEPKDDWVTVLCTVDNKGTRLKDLEWALLLIGPESESPVLTANTLLSASGSSKRIEYLSELLSIKNDCPSDGLFCNCRRLLPLSFFYSENIAIADETLTYRSPLNINDLPSNVAFSVRLIVFPTQTSFLSRMTGRRRLHRSTHSCFIMNKEAEPSNPRNIPNPASSRNS
jgi:hypothetical protein